MKSNMTLWEILVPCMMNGHPCRTKHHKEWDKFVRKLTGGLTILTPSKGQWLHKETGILHEERVIPVRIACSEQVIEKIIEFTIKHYNQIAVMAYQISSNVIIKFKSDIKK